MTVKINSLELENIKRIKAVKPAFWMLLHGRLVGNDTNLRNHSAKDLLLHQFCI